jgi:hypothetical protein
MQCYMPCGRRNNNSPATGFEPPTSWSRTSLDQAKSVELTAFACAFPRLIGATWATKYKWPEFRLLAVAHVQIALFLERMRFWRGTRFRKWTHRNAAGEVFAGCDPHPPHDINGGCVVFLKARLESGNSGQFVQAHHEESIHLRVPN